MTCSPLSNSLVGNCECLFLKLGRILRTEVKIGFKKAGENVLTECEEARKEWLSSKFITISANDGLKKNLI